MREFWRESRAATALVSVLICAALVLMLRWLWQVSAPGASGAQLGTFATTVSAFAAAGAAVASWQSAARSDATSRRASEAVGMTLRPELEASFIGKVENAGELTDYIEVRNFSLWPAINVKATFDSDEGWVREVSLDRIEGGQLPAAEGYPDRPALKRIPVPSVPEEWSPSDDPDCRGKREFIRTMTVEFEDERGFLRWQWVREIYRSFELNADSSSSAGGVRSTNLRRIR